MQIMHIQHSRHSAHRLRNLVQFDVPRQTFEQNIQRFVDDVPGGVNDQAAKSNGKNGIDVGPASVVDSNGTENDGARHRWHRPSCERMRRAH